MCDIEINEHMLKQETVIEVGKFAILWNIFEDKLCENDCSIIKLKSLNTEFIESIYWKNLSQVLKNRVDANECNIDNYVSCKLSLGRGLPPDAKEDIKSFIDSEGNCNKVGGLIAIYRIRNNMYHGLKNWTLLNEQVELFRGINAFLENFLKGCD